MRKRNQRSKHLNMPYRSLYRQRSVIAWRNGSNEISTAGVMARVYGSVYDIFA